jgi:hypoxanthine phosphoribosyltransferase
VAETLEPLIPADVLQARIGELAQVLDESIHGDPVILVGVLKGSFHFLSDLSRRMMSDSRIDFIQTSSYQGGKSSSGIVQIRKDLDTNIEGRNVIIVEDIVDTGVTLNHLRDLLCTRKPKSFQVVSLLNKAGARVVQTQIEHIGFDIPNEFVVGYGLDYEERFRNLPYIAILREG